MRINKCNEQGLSLIESAMVLALAATVTAGVMFYYNNAKEKHNLNESIKQIQTIAATVNKLYAGQSMHNEKDNFFLMQSISEVSGIPLKSIGGELVYATPTGDGIKLEPPKSSDRVYRMEVKTNSRSSCMNFAALNLGTLMKGKTQVGDSNGIVSGHALTPSEANNECSKYSPTESSPVKVTYFLSY